MSILIKGIDLPKDDIYFLFIAENGEVGIKTGLNQYVTLNEAKAIQIDRPHGRLIDWDAFNDKLDISYAEGRGKALAPTILDEEGK